MATEPDVVYQTQNNKKTEKLSDQYSIGKRDRFLIKTAYIIRDTIKAIRTDKIKPVSFGVFYDDLDDLRSGGTGHTKKVCEQSNIPINNQKIWFK